MEVCQDHGTCPAKAPKVRLAKPPGIGRGRPPVLRRPGAPACESQAREVLVQRQERRERNRLARGVSRGEAADGE